MQNIAASLPDPPWPKPRREEPFLRLLLFITLPLINSSHWFSNDPIGDVPRGDALACRRDQCIELKVRHTLSHRRRHPTQPCSCCCQRAHPQDCCLLTAEPPAMATAAAASAEGLRRRCRAAGDEPHCVRLARAPPGSTRTEADRPRAGQRRAHAMPSARPLSDGDLWQHWTSLPSMPSGAQRKRMSAERGPSPTKRQSPTMAADSCMRA